MGRFLIMKGLELASRFYSEAVRPIVESLIPAGSYSAALFGWGSDVLGYDDDMSRDHNWGPRLLIFLRAVELDLIAARLDEHLAATLPHSFLGFPTGFDTSPGGDQLAMKAQESGPVRHFIQLNSLEAYSAQFLGWEYPRAIEADDWLRFDEHKLLGITKGAVFHDGLGILVPYREVLRCYPDDVRLLLLKKQWETIAREESFPGRCNEMGDELAAGLVTARITEGLMRICFLLEGKYAPYSKWFERGFSELQCASSLRGILRSALFASTAPERERSLGECYRAVGSLQNASGLVPPCEIELMRPYSTRPGSVINASRMAEVCSAG